MITSSLNNHWNLKWKPLISQKLSFFLLISIIGYITVSCDDAFQDDMSGAGTVPDIAFTALTNSNQIVKYNAQNPSVPISTVTVNGLAANEQLISLDYRPATGQLYALGSSSRLYFINETTGNATALGTNSFSPTISGNASINFNPTVDRIRLISSTGQNLRLHPETGTVIATDVNINQTNNPMIGAIAYTNSMAGASETKLYDIDFAQDKLYLQNPPNDGALQFVGDLTVDFKGVGSFDISPDNSNAIAVNYENSVSKLYKIDLYSGKATLIGNLNQPIISVAIKTNPVAFASTKTNQLYRFNPMNPMMSPVNLTGLNNNETIVGLDIRPANGALYAISNQSRLFTVNTATGQLSQVGTMPLSPALTGTSFGFDFDPTIDRIRVLSNTGQNIRVHPDLATVVFTDSNLNPGTPKVNAAAYSNNVVGSSTSNLFVIDSQTDMLYSQLVPNNGTLVSVGSLGINIDGDNGFDIGGSSNLGFGLFKVNNINAIYSINLISGTTSKIANFNIDATAMAVGLGF